MLFNSIFRNVNVTLLCITNAACPEKFSFEGKEVCVCVWGGGGKWGGLTWPPLSEFYGSASEIRLYISFRTGLSPPSINVAEGLDLKISKYFGG